MPLCHLNASSRKPLLAPLLSALIATCTIPIATANGSNSHPPDPRNTVIAVMIFFLTAIGAHGSVADGHARRSL